MKQHILVFGARGFIGGRIFAALAATDWAKPVAAQSVGAGLSGIAAVVNCVSDNPGAIIATAQKLFTAMPAKIRVVHVSSMTVYGNVTGLIDESAPLRGELGAYAAAHVAAEKLAATYPKTVIFRPGCEYGPQGEQWSGRIGDFLAARRLGDLGPCGDGYCNLVHVDDVATAVLHALQRPELDGSVFNLSSPQPPTWNEYLIRYAALIGAVPVRRISRKRIELERALAPVQKIIQILARAGGLDARRVRAPIPPSLIRLMAQEIRLNSSRAQQQLDLTWTRLDAGLEASAQWYRSSRAPS